MKEARVRLAQMVLTDTPFNEQFAPAQLHWILADKNECIVIEPMADGLHIYDNPVGVLTNNPPFPQQLFALNNYRALSPRTPAVAFAELPVPKQVCCNALERSATLHLDNVSIDIYPQCGAEQLKALVEILRTC